MRTCECDICKHNLDFELDDFLLSELLNGNLVLFIGARVSTENPKSTPHSLYVSMASELGVSDAKVPFPDLAEEFTSRPDGYFRLVEHIQEHLDYVESFTELRRSARSFFREVASIPFLSTFITTNWDRYIEEECRAKPFIYDTDVRFWDTADRRVLKIHGTIDDYSSIVATRASYEKCEAELQRSLIGVKLKDLLATKTCIFVGYSLRDEDLQAILRFVKTAQGKFAKQHYFLSPFESKQAEEFGLSAIETDGAYFFSKLKEHLAGNSYMIPEDTYRLVEEELSDLVEVHSSFWERYDPKSNPHALLAAMYQDGLIHGYQMILSGRASGRSSDYRRLHSLLHGYELKIAEYRKRKSFSDVAYFQGYQNTILCLLMLLEDPEFTPPPWFYFEKLGPVDQEEYNRAFDQLPALHKGAYKYCVRCLKDLADDCVLDHRPWG